MLDVTSDYDLLRQHVETGSDAAFAALVGRHSDMVYSAARRQVGPGGLADEVTQAVFILLLRKAARLPPGTVVAAWLYKATRYTAMNALRTQARRRRHERKAADMASQSSFPASPPAWPHIAPMLDEAIARLSATDRSAVVLRYLERRSLAEVGATLGVSEHAAQMRVSRAVEKMRVFFQRRGVTLTAAALGVVITAHATQAAPPVLTQTLGVAALKSLAATGAGQLATAAGQAMVMEKVQIAAAIFALAVGTMCLIGVTVHLVEPLRHHQSTPVADIQASAKPASSVRILP